MFAKLLALTVSIDDFQHANKESYIFKMCESRVTANNTSTMVGFSSASADSQERVISI